MKNNSQKDEVLQKIREANLQRRQTTQGWEKINLPNTVVKYINDIKLKTGHMTIPYLQKAIADARKHNYGDYKGFKESMKAIYAKEK